MTVKGEKAKELPEPTERSAGVALLMIFGVVAIGIIITGWLTYRNYVTHYRAEVDRQISAVADLKLNELVQWRRERLLDAAIFFENPSFSSLVRRYFDTPADTEAKRQLQDWLGKYPTLGDCDGALLLDAQGGARLSLPVEGMSLSSVTPPRVRDVLRAGQIVFQDFYRDEQCKHIHLAVLVPVFEESAAHRPLGLLVFRINPSTYLFPFIKLWPTPSPTAETLLVRREGGDVVFLNELRFQTNTALNLRAPLSRVGLPAGQAALGREGIMEGIDYRGVPVVSALRTIPNSPWAMVARMDAAEVYAPTRERLWQVLVLVSVLLFGAGACVGFVWRRQHVRYYRDQYRIAEELRASELRYRRLFETAKDGILILDAETGMVVDVNPFLAKMMGFSHDQFLGKKVWELGFFRDIVANQDNFDELQKKEYLRYEDMALETAGGLRIEVEFISSVYLVSRRKVIQCSIRDISDRKRAEAALHQSAMDLQEKNAELERFLYTASHDLKSPVVTVRTFLGYLEQDMAAGKGERVAQDMGYIRTAVDKMARLLDEVLEISRIGRIISPPVCVAWRVLVDEALAVVAGRISERGVRIMVADEDLPLYGDRLRLAEIWQNLVENAVKFVGDQAAPCIEIGMDQRGADRVFFVRDNGSGIDPRFQAKIFGLFEKLDAKAEGTGIGLAVVKRVVELYGGRIWVESEGLGRGACFCFTLPGAINKRREGE